jgi:hypothetical protein
VLAAVLSLLDQTQEIAPHDDERAHSVREAQVGVHAMTRELRGAIALETTSPYYLSARIVKDGSEVRVAYDCAGSAANPQWGQCLRIVLSGSGPPNSVLVRAFHNTSAVGGPPVFTYVPKSPGGPITYVDIHVEAVVRKDANGRYHYRVPLDDGVHLRNLDV